MVIMLPCFHLRDGVCGLHKVPVPLSNHRPQLLPLLVDVVFQALAQLLDLVDRVVGEQRLQVRVQEEAVPDHLAKCFQSTMKCQNQTVLY